MASSDNTVRGGLTVKHVDVPELLRLIAFRGVTSDVIESSRSDKPCETSYRAPSSEFCLNRIRLSGGDIYENTTYSIEIMLILRGEVTIEALGRTMRMKCGESTIVFAGKTYRISAVSEEALLFKASVPR